MSSKNTFSLLFYLNNSKKNKDGAPIMLRITINGEKVVLYTQRRIQPGDWNKAKGLPCIKDDRTNDLAIYIESLRTKAYNAFTELSRDFDLVTPYMVRDTMKGCQNGTYKTILNVWSEHNDELKQLIGKTCSYTLWQKHNTCKNHFENFLKCKHQLTDMPIRHIRYNIVMEFQQYMIGERRCAYNTTVKFLQLMMKIIIRAQRSGWVKDNPFDDIKLTLKETDRPYLTDEELEAILTKKFKSKRLELVKDLFVFSCYTGLAYADVKKLVKSELEKDSNGMWWIKTRRQKTKQKSQIPLLEIAKSILDKYTDLSELGAEDKILPVLSNQKLNSYLKEIADVCGVEKNLTYHVARHTFATTVTLQNGVSIESVSRMMGHTNIQTTQHYARIVDKKIAEDMLAMSRRTQMNLAV